MKTVRVGENEALTIKKKTVKGISLVFYAEAALVAVGLNAADFDLSKIQVKCTLRRNGQQATLFADMLQVLALESAWFHDRYTNYHAIGASDTLLEMVASGVATKEIVLMPVYIDLGGIIECEDDDELSFQMQFPAASLSADINTSNSYCLVDFDETIGVERAIPYIETQSVKVNETTESVSLTDNVTSITFINLDKTDLLEASKVLDGITIAGDYYHNTDTHYQLHERRLRSLPIPGMNADRGQSFRVLDGLDLSGNDLDAGTIDLQLNGANVNGGKNYLVIRKFTSDLRQLVRSENKLQKHAMNKLARRGAPVSEDVSRQIATIARETKPENWMRNPQTAATGNAMGRGRQSGVDFIRTRFSQT